MAVLPVSPSLAKAGSLLCTLALGLFAGEAARAGAAVPPPHWVATWQASPSRSGERIFSFPPIYRRSWTTRRYAKSRA